MSHLPRLSSFILFIALCISAACWLMPMFSPAPRALAALPTHASSSPNLSVAAGLLGGQKTSSNTNQFQLNGIVQAANTRDSVAIINEIGKTAKAVKVGEKLTAETSLSEIHDDYVLLNDHGNSTRITLLTDNKPLLKVTPASPVATP